MMATPIEAARPGRHLPRDKADTLLLLAAVLLVLAPHATHLPWWVSALSGVTLAWRGLITLRGTRLPPSILLLPLTIMAMGGIYLTFKGLLGREPGVAMAVLLVAFKMLEMHAKRDLYVVIFLSYFLILTNFFYSQSMGTAAMMIASIIALLTAQLSFQYTGVVPPLRKRLALGATILGVAAPLALLLFFLFPRVQGPLWGMPGDATTGKTGMSNTMSPGNIADLAQSTEVAFRVKFDGGVPFQNQLYWRGLVLSDFDGRTWTQSRRNPRVIAVEPNSALLRYQVTMEPHGQRWLFALDMPSASPQMGNPRAFITDEGELVAFGDIHSRIRYDTASALSYTLDKDYLPKRERWTDLPPGFNPRAMQAGLDLQREDNPANRVRKVLAMFRNEPFSYTLQPPLLGTNSVDDFLYNSKAGFCEHYASAFVFLMRAADVPARVVTGYQGGELNPIDDFLTVRQSDAHAWAEVWLDGRGWVRIDPTAAVAPERVERNLARALPPGEQFNLAQLGMELDNTSLLAQLRFRLGAINNGYNQWILNYDPERRRGMLDTLTDALTNWRILAGLALAWAVFVVVRTRRRRSRTDPVDALYSALCQQLARLGITRAAAEGPNAFAQRIDGADLAPDRKQAVLRFLHLYSTYKYGAPSSDPTLVATLTRLLNSQ